MTRVGDGPLSWPSCFFFFSFFFFLTLSRSSEMLVVLLSMSERKVFDSIYASALLDMAWIWNMGLASRALLWALIDSSYS